MIIGSHVKMAAPDYMLGSVKEALSYNANALMIYTGAPQNAKRVNVSLLKVDEAKILLQQNHIDLDNVIIHAPYLINLANSVKENVIKNSKELFISELKRTAYIGAKYFVLHPGSYTGSTLETGLNTFITHVKEVKDDIPSSVTICLETMAGKGSEIGRTFEELETLLSKVSVSNFGVCLDTCHIHDAGYDLSNFDAVLDEFDHIIGLKHLHVIHLNDSKNSRGCHLDRHANIGKGEIGLDVLVSIATNPRIASIPKILETPYIDGKAPYKEEIQLLRSYEKNEN